MSENLSAEVVASHQEEQRPPYQWPGTGRCGAWDPSEGFSRGPVVCPCSIRTKDLTVLLTQSSLPFVEAPKSLFDGLGIFMATQHLGGQLCAVVLTQ